MLHRIWIYLCSIEHIYYLAQGDMCFSRLITRSYKYTYSIVFNFHHAILSLLTTMLKTR